VKRGRPCPGAGPRSRYTPARGLRSHPRMIERVVRYLCDAGVPFRLTVYPTPEPQPEIAYPLAPGSQIVEARVVLVDGSPAMACTPHGLPVDMVALEATSAELRDEFRNASEPLPPLGGLFGTPLFIDDQVATATRVVFRAFAPGAFFDMLYDDLALVERPRVASFAHGGELPPYRSAPRPSA
jgi:hypothetical protein